MCQAPYTPFKVDLTALLQLTQIGCTQSLFNDVKGQGIMILAGDLRVALALVYTKETLQRALCSSA